MTSPTSSTAYTITPGAPAVPIGDGHNSPVGMTILNRGDAGGTVLVQPGPTGRAAALPLGPAATLTWTDPANLPYAVLAAGAGQPETLILTSQASNYANPTVVAAATASQIAAQGVTLSFSSTVLYNATLAGGASTTLNVGGFASVSIWLAPASATTDTCVTVQWSEPGQRSAPAAGTWLSMPATPHTYTVNGVPTTIPGTTLVQAPVLASQLVLTNPLPAGAVLTVAGSNRAVPAVTTPTDADQRVTNWSTIIAGTGPTATTFDVFVLRLPGVKVVPVVTNPGWTYNAPIQAAWVDRTGAHRVDTLTSGTAYTCPGVPVSFQAVVAANINPAGVLTITPA